MNAPAYVAPFVLTADGIIITAVLGGLSLALTRAGWAPSRRGPIMLGAAIILLGWFSTVLALAYAGVFEGVADRWPTIQFGILVPIAIGLVALSRSATVARILDAVPQRWLVGVQTYRALGIIFILVLGAGRLPPHFALPAGWGDIAVGLLAPVVAIAYARAVSGGDTAVRIWNVFGLLDLVVAVGTGFLTSPSPFQLFSREAPNELISAFPLVMVPVFAVPLSVLLHAASLRKLARSGEQSGH